MLCWGSFYAFAFALHSRYVSKSIQYCSSFRVSFYVFALHFPAPIRSPCPLVSIMITLIPSHNFCVRYFVYLHCFGKVILGIYIYILYIVYISSFSYQVAQVWDKLPATRLLHTLKTPKWQLLQTPQTPYSYVALSSCRSGISPL